MFRSLTTLIAFATLAIAAEKPATPIQDRVLPGVRAFAADKSVEPLDEDRFLSDIATVNPKPWRFSFQQFFRSKQRRDDSVEDFYGTELEIKLPLRIHLGRYRKGARSGHLGNVTFELHYTLANFGNPYASDEAFLEMRYSAAGQGEMFMNPQLYTRYILVEHDSPIFETKLRFTEKFSEGWRVSTTFSLEHELRGPGKTEFTASGRLSKNVLNGLFSVGLESKFGHETIHRERGDPEQKFYIGPSLRWRITKNLAASGSWLFGTNEQSNSSEIFCAIKYDFGGPDDQDFAAPVADARN
jgi:hypothetical protein